MKRPRNALGEFISTKRHHSKRRRKNPESRAERSAAAKKGWERRKRRRNPETRAERSAAARKGWEHRRDSHHSRRRHYRRNPSGKIGRAFEGALLPALLFGGGALANDVAYGVVPLPTSMKTGFMAPVGKLITGGVLGLLAAFALKPDKARLAIGGILGGVLYETSKTYLASTFPSLSLSGLADYPPMTYESAAGVLSGSPMTEDHTLLGAYLDNPTGASGGGSVHGLGVYLDNEGE